MSQIDQATLTKTLNEEIEHFIGGHKELNTVYDITLRPDHNEWVVVIRSWGLVETLRDIVDKVTIDKKVREGKDKDGYPFTIDTGIFIRFVKQAKDKEMLIEFIQVYGSKEDAEEALEELNELFPRND